MGRKKKIETSESQSQKCLSGKRIKALRKEKGISQVDLAEKISIAESTLRNYESGRSQIPYDIAELISQELGGDIFPGYLTGGTTAKTMAEYSTIMEHASDIALSELEKINTIEYVQRRTLFEMLGYTFQDFSSSAAYDFSGIGAGDIINKPYTLTNIHDPKETIDLSPQELTDLVTQLSDSIGFLIYKRKRGN